jgi:hypothetical protein
VSVGACADSPSADATRGSKADTISAGAATKGFGLVAIALVSAACAHANPTLVPARVMPAGRVVMDVGGAYVAPVAEPVLSAARVADERVRAGAPAMDSDREALARALAVFGATSAGPASYLAARGGLGSRMELQGALINLRTARVGLRRAFVFDAESKWAFAMGLAARAGVDPLAYRAVVAGAEVRSAQVFGGDFNVQIGRTSSELYDLWLGARAGYTYGAASVFHGAFAGDGVLATRVHRVELSANIGLRVGFGRFAAVAELDTTMAVFFGNADAINARVEGVTLSLVPSGALAITF